MKPKFKNIVFLLLIGALFQACTSLTDNKNYSKPDLSDVHIVNESLSILKLLTKFDTLYINPFNETASSRSFHRSAIIQVDTFSIAQKEAMTSNFDKKILSFTNKNFKDSNVFISENINKRAFNFSNISYGIYNDISYASTLIYWFQANKGWVGLYFYFIKDNSEKYNIELFGEVDLPNSKLVPEKIDITDLSDM